MAATGYSPIQLYYSTTASTAPTAGNLASGELAINITDGKLYYKDNAGAVQLLSTSTTANGTANGVLYLNGSKVATAGTALTFDGTSLTAGRVAANSSGYVVNPASPLFGVYNGNGYLQAPSGGTIQLWSSDTTAIIIADKSQTIFQTAGSEAMRITSTGLGIGTSSPGAKLDVQPATYTFGTAQAEVIRIRGNASGGTTTSPTSAGALVWGNGTITQAVINSIIDNPSASSRSALAFSTNIAGTLTEAMRIDSSGNLLVGTTSGYSNQQGFYFGAGAVSYTSIGHTTAAVSGDLYARFVYNGTGIGSITQNGTTAVAYNTSSDYRLKDNQQPLTGSGAFIDALQPKTWNWKADGSRGVGFIAHEVQEVSPGSVVGEKDGEQMQAMEYGSAEFIANIVAELQSLRARVAQLESN